MHALEIYVIPIHLKVILYALAGIDYWNGPLKKKSYTILNHLQFWSALYVVSKHSTLGKPYFCFHKIAIVFNISYLVVVNNTWKAAERHYWQTDTRYWNIRSCPIQVGPIFGALALVSHVSYKAVTQMSALLNFSGPISMSEKHHVWMCHDE